MFVSIVLSKSFLRHSNCIIVNFLEVVMGRSQEIGKLNTTVNIKEMGENNSKVL